MWSIAQIGDLAINNQQSTIDNESAIKDQRSKIDAHGFNSGSMRRIAPNVSSVRA
jgi:hypothetical protein